MQICLSYPVKNFEVWKHVFDENRSKRESAGLKDISIFRKVGEENTVLTILEGSPDVLKAMLADPDMKAKMKEAGVLAPPEVIVGEKLFQEKLSAVS